LLHVKYNLCSAFANRLGMRSISSHIAPFEACMWGTRAWRRQCYFSAIPIWTLSLFSEARGT